jgi:predicted RNase H-like HicB family nuclease
MLLLFYYDTMRTTLRVHVSKMVINLNVPQSNPPSNLKVTLLVENLTSGHVVASVLEFPDCRVEADTREKAINQIKTAFLERLKHIEAISWDVPVQPKEPTWMQFGGIFKDDTDFISIMETIRAERNSHDDSEVDPSYYL